MYAVHFSTRAARDLRDCPQDLRDRILAAVEGLARDPRPQGCRRLSGRLSGAYRIRVGPYRVLYDIRDTGRDILILKVGPRKSVYR